jgi:hypothetical protein
MKATANAFDHLETGTNVVISYDLGFPVIVGVIDFVGAEQAAITPPSLTGLDGYGDNDATQPTDGFNNYKPPTAPTDMQQGDWAQVGTAGNHVAVLAGGVTLMGSPTAQVRSMGVAGTLQSVARRVQTVTDWGQWQTFNDQGKTSFILRAGSSQATETGQDEQNWGIRLDLGATGDVLDFSITEPKGQTLFRLHAGSDGRVQLYGEGGVDISSGPSGTNKYNNDVAGSRSVSVGIEDSLDVGTNSTTNIGGNAVVQIGGNSQTTVAQGAISLVTGDNVQSTGGDSTTSVVGDTRVITSGLYEVTAADELSLSTPVKATLSGSQVVLGTQGSHPLPKFDSFLTDLATFLSTILPDIISALVPSNPIVLVNAMSQLAVYATKVSSMQLYVSQIAFND